MSSPNRSNLPDGAFLTIFNGRRCTAVPRGGAKTRSNNQQRQSTSTSHSTSTSSSTTRSTPPPQTSAPPPVAPPPPPPQTSAPPPVAPPPPPPPPPVQTTPLPPPPPPALTTSSASTTSSSLLPPPAPPPPPPPAATTPSPAPGPPLQQTQAPPAPVVSSPPPPPPPLFSSSTTPPLVDAEPATIPTFQQIPSIPSQSVPLPAQLPPPQSSSTSLPVIQDLPPSTPGASQTDVNTVPTQPVQTPPAFVSEASPSPTSSPEAAAPTVGLNPGTAAGEAGNGSNPPSSSQPSSGGSRSGGVATPVVIASSVVGAVAVIGLLGFLLWLWRKRSLRKRRSTLLTPLSTDPSFRTGEKPYIIDRESLGPTPRSAKLKAALGYNFSRFRGQVGGLVSRNRDSSSTRSRTQFMNISQHSRNSSSMSNHAGPRNIVTTTDRLKDWWERLTADMRFNWRLRGDRNTEKDPFASTRDMMDRKAAMGGQPDFLTLLGMDEREVEREAQRRRLSRGKDSAGSAEHFLGGLGLNFDNASANPFSDINALPHDSAKPAPLAVANPTTNNPFSDTNAISAPAAAVKPPTTYVADVRRSRGTSIGGSTTRPPSGSTFSPRMDSMYRDSLQSVESFSTRRNKFRSDPFDLERPELLGSRATQASSNYSQVGGMAPRIPGSAHTRAGSFSSKYSSGVSMDGWSDPGPDVGPAGGSSSYRPETESPTVGYRPGEQRKPSRRPSQTSQGSQNSVGKAL
ncbi:uncharacterized protein CTRU02_206075 [Colletotrichum truncatum]|uniref:Uncharacterized protein n=1 Tax=Colletotrichum truncatum TaxID=5467 RepID=A0ACC3Z652_COLTU|nr:uncharacterized protein CTRU02_10513 [Colletotrichum truncatum]KAF6787250.1 hypothetical protein CTRU02_10513 [Colletotrichum truncatum]